jgi:hypothetical protein
MRRTITTGRRLVTQVCCAVPPIALVVAMLTLDVALVGDIVTSLGVRVPIPGLGVAHVGDLVALCRHPITSLGGCRTLMTFGW